MQNTVDKQSDEAKEVSIIVDSQNVVLCNAWLPPAPCLQCIVGLNRTAMQHSEMALPYTVQVEFNYQSIKKVMTLEGLISALIRTNPIAFEENEVKKYTVL